MDKFAEAATYQTCLQCDQDSDSGCADGTIAGVVCPRPMSEQPYCTVSNTSMYDSSERNP